MIKRVTIGNRRLTFSYAKIGKVLGVNSNLADGRHVLMWDFDNTKLDKVVDSLKVVQKRYNLSAIYILESKRDKNFMAYCFTGCLWSRAVKIVIDTQGVDYQFVRFGVYRSHFTLRVSPKDNRIPRHVRTLGSDRQPDCIIEELRSWVYYETLIKGS